MGNQSLVLQSLTRDNSGEYSCQAVNSIGRGMSPPRVLDIKCKLLSWGLSNQENKNLIDNVKF